MTIKIFIYKLRNYPMKINKLKCAIVASLMIVGFSVQAEPYSNIYVFGDSLSDNGNLSMAPGAPAGTPTRFTNGPVALEVVAASLGFALTPSDHLNGGYSGNNFAIAGAKTLDDDGDEMTPDINLPTQVNAFLQINGGVAPSDALYVVLIGGNDIREARDIRAGAIFGATVEERRAIRQAATKYLEAATESQQDQIEKLIASGAQHILVANAPDIGAIPETDLVIMGLLANAQTQTQINKINRFAETTTMLSAKFNGKLGRKLERTEDNTGVELIEFNLFNFLNDQIEDAEVYGLTNISDACIYIFSQGGTINPECSDFPTASGFLFWDEVHPTTAVHQRAGIAILDELLNN
jgi:outer membrane lipase/esterase